MIRTHRVVAALAALSAVVPVVAASPGSAASAGRWAPPVLISEDQAAREVSLALSPTDPRLLAACAPSGAPNVFEGQSYFHASRDGGRTWALMDVEPSLTDPRRAAFEGGDCDVAFDRGGTLYAADTWLGNLSVGSSTDGGRTWSGTSVAVSSPVVDRPWLVGGPEGTVYLSYHDLQCCMPSAMWFTKSTDYGRTFQPAVPIPTPGPEGAYVWEGNFVVAKDGRTIHLVFSRRLTPTVIATPTPGGTDIFVATSVDGGQLWSTSRVATLTDPASSIYPSIGVDGGGHLHVVYSAPGLEANPAYWTTSTDRGRTWSDPVPLINGGINHAPWVVGGARAGEAVIAWIGSPHVPTDADSDWYFYASRIRPGRAGRPLISTVRTTSAPMFTGAQPTPEFEMVALDRQGRMHLGMAAYRERSDGTRRWAMYHQRELRVPK